MKTAMNPKLYFKAIWASPKIKLICLENINEAYCTINIYFFDFVRGYGSLPSLEWSSLDTTPLTKRVEFTHSPFDSIKNQNKPFTTINKHQHYEFHSFKDLSHMNNKINLFSSFNFLKFIFFVTFEGLDWLSEAFQEYFTEK